jgi:hypothetical protein
MSIEILTTKEYIYIYKDDIHIAMAECDYAANFGCFVSFFSNNLGICPPLNVNDIKQEGRHAFRHHIGQFSIALDNQSIFSGTLPNATVLYVVAYFPDVDGFDPESRRDSKDAYVQLRNLERSIVYNESFTTIHDLERILKHLFVENSAVQIAAMQATEKRNLDKEMKVDQLETKKLEISSRLDKEVLLVANLIQTKIADSFNQSLHESINQDTIDWIKENKLQDSFVSKIMSAVYRQIDIHLKKFKLNKLDTQFELTETMQRIEFLLDDISS